MILQTYMNFTLEIHVKCYYYEYSGHFKEHEDGLLCKCIVEMKGIILKPLYFV